MLQFQHDSLFRKGKSRSNWFRRFCAFVTALIGMLACAGSLMPLFDRELTSGRLSGLGYLLGALLLIWVGARLSIRKASQTRIMQILGVIGFGLVAGVLTARALPMLLMQTGLINNAEVSTAVLAAGGGVLFLLLLIVLITSNETALAIWFFAAFVTVLLQMIEFIITAQNLVMGGQPFLVIAAALTILPTGIALYLLRKLPTRTKVVAPKAKTTRTSAPPIPQYFPTVQHELLARGRFCELFGVPCSAPCPLPTQVATKYQQLRLEHERSPQILEALEKAYVILITPRQRALCNVAHDIMRIKAKELGPKRFGESEIEMWTYLWARLQDTELKGDAQRAAEAKLRIVKEL
ncbi:MAG: hypothetical protein ACYC7E_20460 [Armatimonadota bacterium]